MASKEGVFVTVGTTKFNDFIEAVTSTDSLAALVALGHSRLTVQVGTGTTPKLAQLAGRTDDVGEDEEVTIDTTAGPIVVSYFTLKPGIGAFFEAAALVISHAGAGSITEALRAGANLVVVVNEKLMGNHQLELAESMADRGHLFYCTPETLVPTLEEADFSSLSALPAPNTGAVAACIDDLMGFA